MAKNSKTWTLAELATLLGGTLLGDGSPEIRRPAPADSDDPFGLAFAADEAYLESALQSGVGAIIVPESVESCAKPAIRHKQPRAAFGRFLEMNVRALSLNKGVHPTAIIDESAHIDSSAQIGPYVVIEADSVVGPGCRLYPFAYIGENSQIGARTVLYPHAVVLQDVTIGEDCIVAPGAVIGFDGFGFVWTGEKQYKVPQVGSVHIEDHVEVGANTTIDRATSGVTKVSMGVKLDNLVQIAHNCELGEHSVFASLVGMSGSTKVGSRVTVGGQVGFKGHLSVADDVTLAGRAGVTNDILESGFYGGFPLQPLGKSLRSMAVYASLPELSKRVKDLERTIAELKQQSKSS